MPPSHNRARSTKSKEPETDVLDFAPISSIRLEMMYQKELVAQMRDELRVALEKLKQTNPSHPMLKDKGFESVA